MLSFEKFKIKSFRKVYALCSRYTHGGGGGSVFAILFEIFKLRFLSEFLSKIHDKVCVEKPLTHTFHLSTLRASASILRASTRTFVYICWWKWLFFDENWHFCCRIYMLRDARGMLVHARKMHGDTKWVKSFLTHYLRCIFDKNYMI